MGLLSTCRGHQLSTTIMHHTRGVSAEQHLRVEPLPRGFALHRPDQHIDCRHVGIRPQYFLKEHFADESCTTCNEYGFAAVEFG